MKLLINYANREFRKSQAKNSSTGLRVGGFDDVRSFGPEDIDPQFLAKNRHILSQERGNGYWLWKPYFIERALSSLADGDILFYSDSGAHFVASIDPLIELCTRDRQDVIVFELHYPEREWTKRDAFVLAGCDTPQFTDTPQRLASFSLWRRSPASLAVAREWLDLAQDERLLTDVDNQMGLPNYPGFREHRHDQSLFSLVTKKHGLQAYRHPGQQGLAFIKAYPNSPYGQILQHTRGPKGRRAWKWKALAKVIRTLRLQWLPLPAVVTQFLSTPAGPEPRADGRVGTQ